MSNQLLAEFELHLEFLFLLTVEIGALVLKCAVFVLSFHVSWNIGGRDESLLPLVVVEFFIR